MHGSHLKKLLCELEQIIWESNIKDNRQQTKKYKSKDFNLKKQPWNHTKLITQQEICFHLLEPRKKWQLSNKIF